MSRMILKCPMCEKVSCFDCNPVSFCAKCSAFSCMNCFGMNFCDKVSESHCNNLCSPLLFSPRHFHLFPSIAVFAVLQLLLQGMQHPFYVHEVLQISLRRLQERFDVVWWGNQSPVFFNLPLSLTSPMVTTYFHSIHPMFGWYLLYLFPHSKVPPNVLHGLQPRRCVQLTRMHGDEMCGMRPPSIHQKQMQSVLVKNHTVCWPVKRERWMLDSIQVAICT